MVSEPVPLDLSSDSHRHETDIAREELHEQRKSRC
jgi:hypothetical protein